MAYNTGFSDMYQNAYPQNNNMQHFYTQPYYGQNQAFQSQNYSVPQYNNQMNQQNQNQHNNTGIIWVQGEAGAKAFSNLRPDIPIALWDSEEPVIYIKSVDNTGKPSMTILDYTERNNNTPEQPKKPQIEYVTKEQLDDLNNQYSSFSDQLKELDGHVKEIENRITSFGKPQQNNNNRRGNK